MCRTAFFSNTYTVAKRTKDKPSTYKNDEATDSCFKIPVQQVPLYLFSRHSVICYTIVNIQVCLNTVTHTSNTALTLYETKKQRYRFQMQFTPIKMYNS